MYNYNLFTTLIKQRKVNNNILTSLAELTRKQQSSHHTRNPEHWKIYPHRTNYATQTLRYNIPHLLNVYLNNNIDIFQLSAKHLKHIFLSRIDA